MVRLIGIGLAGLVLVTFGVWPRSAATEKADLRIGMLQGMFKDVPPALIQTVSRPFSDLFAKQTGLTGAVELFPESDTLASKMKTKRVDIGVFHGFEFAWIRQQHPEIKPLVVTAPHHRQARACLIVAKASTAATPADLKGVKLTLPIGTKAHCQLYVDLLRKTLPKDCCVPEAGAAKLTPEEVLDGVGEGKIGATVVEASSLDAYITNKPGLAKELRTLCQSETFPPAVIAYRAEAMDAPTVARIHDGLIGANGTSQARVFLMLWKLKGFEDLPADFDAQMKLSYRNFPPPAPAAATVPTIEKPGRE